MAVPQNSPVESDPVSSQPLGFRRRLRVEMIKIGGLFITPRDCQIIACFDRKGLDDANAELLAQLRNAMGRFGSVKLKKVGPCRHNGAVGLVVSGIAQNDDNPYPPAQPVCERLSELGINI